MGLVCEATFLAAMKKRIGNDGMSLDLKTPNIYLLVFKEQYLLRVVWMFPHMISLPSINHILPAKQSTNTTWCRFYLMRTLSCELLRQLCQTRLTVNNA